MSGLFVPLSALGTWGQTLAWLSPLTFANDVLHGAMGGSTYYAPLLDLAMLAAYWAVFLWVGLRLHEMGRQRGL